MKRAALLFVGVISTLLLQSTHSFAANPTTDSPADTTELPDLEGVWAQKLVTTAVSKVPLIGEIISQTVTLQRVTIAQSGTELVLDAQTCDVQLESNQSSLATHIPRRFVDAIDAPPRKAYLRKRKGGYYLLAPGRTKTLGVKLAGDSDKLPTEASDPRVFDQDEDGHPGMTVRVSGFIDGKLYMLQKSWDRLWGKLLEGDRIAGRVKWKAQQVVLDSTSSLLGSPPDSKPHADPKQSYFRMTRVDAHTSCNDIRKNKKTLF